MVRSLLFSLSVVCVTVCTVFLPSRDVFCEDTRTESGAFEAGQEAFDNGSYERAMDILERFIQTYPGSSLVPPARLLIGQALFHRHKYYEALEYFEGLRDMAGFIGLQDAVLYWIAEVHFRSNNFSRAASYYREIIDRYPSSEYANPARYSLGWSLFEEGAYAKALNQFTALEDSKGAASFLQDAALKIVECLYNLKEYVSVKQRVARYLRSYGQDPLITAYLSFYLGESEYYTDNYPAAVAAYEKAAQYAPDRKMKALAQVGSLWARIKMKDFAGAESAAQQINVGDLEKPNQDILMLARAAINAGLGKQQEAEEVYMRVISQATNPLVVAQGHLGRAEALYEKGDYGAAAAGYELALSNVDERAVSGDMRDSIRQGLAWARLREGDYRAALEEFERIARDSRDEDVKVGALCQIGDAHQDSGDFIHAEEVYEQILRDYPKGNYVDYVRYRQGILLLRKGQNDGAVSAFSSLLREFPQSPLLDKTTYALGLAYFQASSYDAASDALRVFKTGFADSPVRAQALYILGVSLRNIRKYEEALDVFSTIVAGYEENSDLCLKAEYQIADCHFRGGDEKEALAMFKKLRSKYPDATLTADIIWWLGDYYYRMQKPDIARRYFTALIDDFPDSSLAVEAHYALGVSLEEESLHQEAIEHFQEVILRGKSDLAVKAVIAVAEIYAKKSRFVEAAAFMSKHLDVVPEQGKADMHFRIGQQLETGRNPDAAVEEYLKAAYLYPDNKDVAVKSYFRAAQIYESIDKKPEAIVLYERIIGLNTPEAKVAQERLDALSSD